MLYQLPNLVNFYCDPHNFGRWIFGDLLHPPPSITLPSRFIQNGLPFLQLNPKIFLLPDLILTVDINSLLLMMFLSTLSVENGPHSGRVHMQ